MTDGAFEAHGFILSDLVDWLVGPAFLLAYLPPACTQNSGWCPTLNPFPQCLASLAQKNSLGQF
jgi:hypothetical protein